MTALARLAIGQPGPETEAMIAAFLAPIADCWDCADFYLVPLLWIRARYAAALSPALLAEIDRTILAYRYWLDEPGNDVQWYFSENHALLFHTSAYLAGHLLPDARFVRSGRTGAEQSATGRARVRAWLDHFERWEMAEFNSAPYFPIDLKGLTALHALAPDPDIRARAARGIARLLEIVANSAHQGILTAAQGRSYEHSLRAGRSLELSAIARLLWGRGAIGARLHALPQLALCLRDHGLALPDLTPRALWQGDAEQEWSFRQGENGFAALNHTKTRAWALGTAAALPLARMGLPGDPRPRPPRHRPPGADLDQPPRRAHPVRLRPPLLLGRQRLDPPRPAIPRPRAGRLRRHRRRNPTSPTPGSPAPPSTRATSTATPPSPAPATASPPSSPTAPSRKSPPAPAPAASSAAPAATPAGSSASARATRPFRARFAALALTEHPDGRIIVDDPDYGVVEFNPDGTVTAEGRTLDPARWTIEGTRTERDRTSRGGHHEAHD